MAFPPTPAAPAAPPPAAAPAGAAPAIVNSAQPMQDADYLNLFDRCKRESFVDRWRFERVWTRNIHYANLRQWLGTYDQAAKIFEQMSLAKEFPEFLTLPLYEAME